jgi:hypothetical protein
MWTGKRERNNNKATREGIFSSTSISHDFGCHNVNTILFNYAHIASTGGLKLIPQKNPEHDFDMDR